MLKKKASSLNLSKIPYISIGCCDIDKILNIDINIEKKNTGNIDIFDIFLLGNYW